MDAVLFAFRSNIELDRITSQGAFQFSLDGNIYHKVTLP